MCFKKIVISLALCLPVHLHAQTEQKNIPGPFRISVNASLTKDFVYTSSKDIKLPKDKLRTAEVGPAVTAEYFVLNWLSLGLRYAALFEVKDSKILYQDIDAVGKFLLSSPASNDNSELYLGLPIGLSIMTDGDKNFATGKGFHIGGVFGGNYFLNNFFGFNFEAGYSYRRLDTKLLTHSKAYDIGMNFHTIGFKLGVVARF